ncbi:MAG: hypothetical protein GWO44_21995, partial [Thermoplasmata archaeon]|nr:hypothetical protein [Thermoplasmata archaeon]NIY05854.1 hypothetical protein [Thermoplasmata archaeon]
MLNAEEVEEQFSAMYSELSTIQDPNLVRTILEEMLTEHPLVSWNEGSMDLSGNLEEGLAFCRDFAR